MRIENLHQQLVHFVVLWPTLRSYARRKPLVSMQDVKRRGGAC
jgi:hypothetical protein